MNRTSSSASHLLVTLLVTLGVGCARASGEAQGGDDVFDAAPPLPFSEPVPDAAGLDAGALDFCVGGDPDAAVGPTTWTAIYTDYFGGTSRSSCAGTGRCHGPGGSQDALSVYECKPDDKNACYASMTRVPLGIVVKGKPDESSLLAALRKEVGGGIMPRDPRCFFRTRDTDRIRTWIQNGANND